MSIKGARYGIHKISDLAAEVRARRLSVQSPVATVIG